MKWKEELNKLPLEYIKSELKSGKYVVFQIKSGFSSQGMRTALSDIFSGYPIYKHKSKFIVGRRENNSRAPREFNRY